MDTYFRPFNFVVYNYETNFNSKEFRSALRFAGNTLKLILVEVYYSISKVKRYHRLLRRAYNIITEEHPELSDKERIQIAVKVVNNIAKPNRLIPTLLIFRAYFRLTELNLLNPLVK